jgi:hypothetical protein
MGVGTGHQIFMLRIFKEMKKNGIEVIERWIEMYW